MDKLGIVSERSWILTHERFKQDKKWELVMSFPSRITTLPKVLGCKREKYVWGKSREKKVDKVKKEKGRYSG